MPSTDLRQQARRNPAATGGQNNPGAAAVDALNRHAESFATVLPSHLNPDQWLRLAAGLLRRNPKLAAAALSNPASFFAALMDCARLGLVPGDTYHLVPYGRDIVGITDYTGEIELIYRAGMVRSVKCEVVYANDHWSFAPADDRPDHRPDWFGDRGEMIGVYAYAEFKDGGTSRVAVLSRKDIEKIKAVSKTAGQSDSPWNKWEDRMWRKTAVKQLTGWVPSSAEYRVEQLRAEATALALPSGIGSVQPTRDYAELPPIPMAVEGGQTVDTSTGELSAGPVTAAVAVEEPPEDYDPTADPSWQQGDN